MVHFEVFVRELKSFLHHYRSSDLSTSEVLCEVLGCPPEQGVGTIYNQVREAIEKLKPAEDLPEGGNARRLYTLIHLRFLDGLTLEETAQRLYVSARQCQRIQADAIRALALLLWESNDSPEKQAIEDTWLAQAELEMASLEGAASESVADIQSVVSELMAFQKQLATAYGITLEVGYIQPGLTATVHPNVLRQMIILIIGRLARHVTDGKILIFARLEDGNVKFSFGGRVSNDDHIAPDVLFDEVLVPQGCSLQAIQRGEQVYVQALAPTAKQDIVLVIEDNLDIVHFYRRCTVGTNFQIIHASTLAQVKEMLQSDPPEVIVLDLMMADIDGWQLLSYLHENPDTRSIPVIVCSIIYERELAYALGAVNCLRKPVKHRVFVEALHQALARSRPAGLPEP